MKKILALLLALVMLFGVLAGCTAKKHGRYRQQRSGRTGRADTR